MEINRIFREENVSYKVDELGVAHFWLDAEFEATRASSIAVLTTSRYANVRQQVERAYGSMDQNPADGKTATRSIFTGVEGLFRLMFPTAQRLGGNEAESNLRKLLETLEGDTTAKRATGKWLNGFKEWVEAAHFYRHEQGSEEPVQPPLSLAVALLSSGTVYLRWLAELDQTMLNEPA